MSNPLYRNGVGYVFFGFLLLLLSASASAQTVNFDILLDVDRDAATGCTVAPNGQPALSGFERLSIT